MRLHSTWEITEIWRKNSWFFLKWINLLLLRCCFFPLFSIESLFFRHWTYWTRPVQFFPHHQLSLLYSLSPPSTPPTHSYYNVVCVHEFFSFLSSFFLFFFFFCFDQTFHFPNPYTLGTDILVLLSRRFSQFHISTLLICFFSHQIFNL